VVPKGGIAWGTVTDAQPKRRMGRGGKLDVHIDSVRLTDGEKVPLRAVKDVKGGGHTGAMAGAMVGTAIVFFPQHRYSFSCTAKTSRSRREPI